jgi:cytochrome c oxidase subunit II
MFLGPANTTGKVDSAFFFIVAVAAILLTLVMIVMMVFLIKYRRKRHPEPEAVKESILLEVVWTVVPLGLVMVMFYFGWVDFEYIRNPPPDAMEVDVTARQWSWLFHYANGKEDDVLRVPANQPVKLIMTSVDVLHCLFIPAFRIKEDCVPGLKTHLWFNASEIGTYEIFCSEYCGVGHSHMRSSVIVLSQSDFDTWYRTAEEAGPAAEGLKVIKGKGCLGCHSLDGSRLVGPTFKGLVGKPEEVTTGGAERTVTVDAAYIKGYILNPNQDVIKGYPPVMPKIPLTDEEINEVVAYLETVK